MVISEYFVLSYSQVWPTVSPQISLINSKDEFVSRCRNKHQVKICIPAYVISSVISTMISLYSAILKWQNCFEAIYIKFKRLKPVEIS